MIKRTIEISQNPAHLTVRLDQLLVQPHDQPPESHRSIPCEDLGVVLVDHLPAGILLPLSDHTQVVWRIHDQLSISKPRKKQLWQQIVQAKIRAQACNLAEDSPQRVRLLAMAREVRSDDVSNMEAQAAKIYWGCWLAPHGNAGPGERVAFRRDPDGDPPNHMLNYGYAVVQLSDEHGPLLIALHRMVASLVHCYDGSATELAIPHLPDGERKC